MLIKKLYLYFNIQDGKKHVPIKIHFVGVMQFPDVEMLEKAKEEMIADAKKAS